MTRTMTSFIRTGLSLALVLSCAATGHSRFYENQEQPKPFIIPGVVTIQFEDDVDLQQFAKSFGQVSFGIPSFDKILGDLQVSDSRALFPWHTEKPQVNSGLKDMTRYYEISFPEKLKVTDVIAAVQQNPNIRMAEPVWAMPLDASPNDPSWSSQWAMEPPAPDPDFYDAWDLETGSDSIIFALIDSGILYNHNDLKGNIWVNPGEDMDGDLVVFDNDDLDGVDNDGNGVIDDLVGYDFFSGIGIGVWPGEDAGGPDPDPSDHNGHGTHVAGIAAAMNNNGIDVTGAAGGWYGGHPSFRGVQIMCLRIGATGSDGNGYVNSNNAGTAIDYAANMGANVFNMSWGTSATSTMIAALSNAAAHGMTATHASGNDNCDCPDYVDGDPFMEILSVASTGPNSDSKSGFSNFGTWIDVSAPGSSILSTYSNFYSPTIATLGGTSMAAPMVSGEALLIRSMMPSLTKQQVDSLIMATADNIDGINPTYAGRLGTGRINAFTALSALANAKFTADVAQGNAPLTVNFTDLSPNSPTAWTWTFGNGDGDNVQNPSYTYNDAGIYNVSLIEEEGNPLGPGEEHLRNYIWVTADTLIIDSVSAQLGTQAVVPVYLSHTAQIKEINFAFTIANSAGVSLDSFSTIGLRTDYFESVQYTLFDPGGKRYNIQMRPNVPGTGSTYLTPDTGAILTLYFDVSAGGTVGSVIPIDTMSLGGTHPVISTIFGDYWPTFTAGQIVIPSCAPGDVNCDGNGPDIVDLTDLVEYLFGEGFPIDPVGADCNVDGDVNVLDLTCIVDFLFGGP